jgi:hypothetical protein
MDHLNAFLGAITALAALYVAAAWWRIWRREKPWRRRRARKIPVIERPTTSTLHGTHQRQRSGAGRLRANR